MAAPVRKVSSVVAYIHLTLMIVFKYTVRVSISDVDTNGAIDKRFKSPPFHGGVTGSNPVGVIH